MEKGGCGGGKDGGKNNRNSRRGWWKGIARLLVLLTFQRPFRFVSKNYAIGSAGKRELSKFPAISRTHGHLCWVNLPFVSFPFPPTIVCPEASRVVGRGVAMVNGGGAGRSHRNGIGEGGKERGLSDSLARGYRLREERFNSWKPGRESPVLSY